MIVPFIPSISLHYPLLCTCVIPVNGMTGSHCTLHVKFIVVLFSVNTNLVHWQWLSCVVELLHQLLLSIRVCMSTHLTLVHGGWEVKYSCYTSVCVIIIMCLVEFCRHENRLLIIITVYYKLIRRIVKLVIHFINICKYVCVTWLIDNWVPDICSSYTCANCMAHSGYMYICMCTV